MKKFFTSRSSIFITHYQGLNVKQLDQASSKQGAETVTTSIFPQTLSILSQCALVLIGGHMVVNDGMSVGTFLALFSIFRVMGGELAKIYLDIVHLLIYSVRQQGMSG